jgi:hypothetical protein
MTTRHFKNKKSYSKWLAWGHMHKVFETTPGNQTIILHGKKHKVKHRKR